MLKSSLLITTAASCLLFAGAAFAATASNNSSGGEAGSSTTSTDATKMDGAADTSATGTGQDQMKKKDSMGGAMKAGGGAMGTGSSKPAGTTSTD